MSVVKGVILDESVLLAKSFSGNGEKNASFSLQPGVEFLIRTLLLSRIHIGIAYSVYLPENKACILKNLASLYSLHCFILEESVSEIVMPEWCEIEARNIIYFISRKKDLLLPSLRRRYNWLIVVMNVESESEVEIEVEGEGEGEGPCDASYIGNFEELPLAICRLNKRLIGNNFLVVGYTMKPSRVEDFAKRGAFPLCPTQNGLMFVPLMAKLPLSSQLEDVDIVLHKATDEILSIEENKITFTQNMQELQRYLDQHQDLCVVDPLVNIYPILDHFEIQQILLGLLELNVEGSTLIRRARFLKVDNFSKFDFVTGLADARLSLPCIVKPKVACGVSDAHKMAIVFRVDDFKNLSVPLPAVIQEYVDHSSTLYKFYVLGEKVFYAVKKSMPNSNILIKLANDNDLNPLEFDSLKSLPTAESIVVDFGASNESIDLKLVTDAANWLRRRLHLTVFGFDVVIQEGTCDHVIVDVNYLPSFKEVPDDISIPAFWEAIRNKFDCMVSKQACA